MPYYSDGEHVYMSGPTPGGGLDTLGGKDPGWTTVASYAGQGTFGSISGSTKFWTAFETATGQDLETTRNENDDIHVEGGTSGTPTIDGDSTQSELSAPEDKPWWDATAPVEPDAPLDPVTHKRIELNNFAPNNTAETEAAVGGASLAIQVGQAYQNVQNLASHTHREYAVDYQVNVDGRTRAVVHTYAAAQSEDGNTKVIGSFANAFPDGKEGSTAEVAYNHYVPPSDANQTYVNPGGQIRLGDPTDGAGLIGQDGQLVHEKLNK